MASQPTRVSTDEHEHDRHEDRRHPVGQPLDVGLAGLRLLDEASDPGQCRVGADPRGAHDEPSADVDGRAGDVVARAHLHRDGLAGEHRRVDGGGPLLHHAVGGDLLPGADDEPHPDAEVVDGETRSWPTVEHGDLLGAQRQERLEGGPRPALGLASK